MSTNLLVCANLFSASFVASIDAFGALNHLFTLTQAIIASYLASNPSSTSDIQFRTICIGTLQQQSPVLLCVLSPWPLPE